MAKKMEGPRMHMYRISCDEDYWFAATSKEEATRLFKADNSDMDDESSPWETFLRAIQEPDNEVAAVVIRHGQPMVLAMNRKEIEQFRKDWGPEELNIALIKSWRLLATGNGLGFFASTA